MSQYRNRLILQLQTDVYYIVNIVLTQSNPFAVTCRVVLKQICSTTHLLFCSFRLPNQSTLPRRWKSLVEYSIFNRDRPFVWWYLPAECIVSLRVILTDPTTHQFTDSLAKRPLPVLYIDWEDILGKTKSTATASALRLPVLHPYRSDGMIIFNLPPGSVRCVPVLSVCTATNCFAHVFI